MFLYQDYDEDEVNVMRAAISEKEGLITQLTVQVDSLQTEISDLQDFQVWGRLVWCEWVGEWVIHRS